MTTDFWFGMTTLPAAVALVALICGALAVISRVASFVFGACRHGHRIEIVRDRDDPQPEKVVGTTWECRTCSHSWRVVGSVHGPGPTVLNIKKKTR